ncbi:MAG: CdaR family protein [Herbinix sp.]|nr:CdaR family protein [Herbinix sp.]
MKEKLTRNIGLKILSIILAAILWLVITNVDDPITPRNFNNVPVEILNANEVTNLGQVYDILEGETIDFTAAARRTIADNLTVSDFKVTADFSKLSDVNAVTINISCPGYEDDVTITNGLYQVMKVSLEELAEKHFKVNVVQKGEPAEGYYVYEKTANTILRVSGPKSKIESIAQIVVDVDVTEVAGSFHTSEAPKALDADGNEIDASNLDFSETSVSIYIGMYRTKTIDLNITTNGNPADGYIMTNIEYEPKTIEVAADDEILNSLGNLTVTEDIEGASKDIEKEVNLQDQLKDDVILVGDNQTAVVNIKIEKTETKDITILPGDIDVRNKPDSLNLAYLTNGPLIIKVVGPAKELKEITQSTLNPYINLSNYSVGTYSVEVKANFTGYVKIENIPLVKIHLIQ